MGTDIQNQNQQNQGECWNLESALDVLIVLLYSKGPEGSTGEPIEGITRLDKIMYLLSKSPEFQGVVNKGYQFEADNFGPFAPELFDDVEALKQENIIAVTSSRDTKTKIETIDEEYVETEAADRASDEGITSWATYPVERYELTEEGKRIGSLLFNCLSEQQKIQLKNVKSIFGGMKLSALLHYVYTKYPELTDKSKIRNRVLH